MKLIHLSDLHLGKRVNDYSMLEDQKYILTKIINIIDGEKPDGVIIAGDVYDKSVPSVEAVSLFDDFLKRLAKRRLEVFVISGNHDSPERVAFASELIDISGVHMSPVYSGEVKKHEMTDSHGTVNIYMLPFIKPVHVRKFYPGEDTTDYTNAMAAAVKNMNVNTDERNILVAHQFLTSASRSESEEVSVGGLDNVDASVFDDFDYVALGHIHGPQHIGRETIRYCGTPLKYSFSEAAHKKSVTIVEMNEKGSVKVRTAELIPMRDMREIKDSFDEIMHSPKYTEVSPDDYLHITLTDEEDVINALGLLRGTYPNIMKLDYDNKRTRQSMRIDGAESIETKTPLELFEEFYELQNNAAMSDEQREFSRTLIEQIWEGGE